MKITTLHSTLDANALQTMVLSHYALGEVYWCKFLWFLGMRMANTPVIWGYAWTDTQNELKFLQRLEESAGYDPNI